jgi:hypothetical protein
MYKYILAALLSLIPVQAFADVHISDYDGGGSIQTYKAYYDRWFASSERLIVDAPCLSACTLFLMYQEKVPERICITSRGSLGFHQAAVQTGPDPVLTQLLVRAWYPEWVQKFIAEKGGLTVEILPMWPEDMQGHIAMCNGESVPSVPADSIIKKDEPKEETVTEGNREIITPEGAPESE